MFYLGASKFWIFIDAISLNLKVDKHNLENFITEWVFSE
jgi:hypothetical protein